MARSGAHRQTRKGCRAAALIALVMALTSGAWVVALGWSVAFLLSESVLMAVYGVLVLISPALYTVVAILAWRGAYAAAMSVTGVLIVKWLAAYLYAVIDGGLEALGAAVPIGHAISFTGTGYFGEGDVLPGVLAIIHFDVEPLVAIALLLILIRAARK